MPLLVGRRDRDGAAEQERDRPIEERRAHLGATQHHDDDGVGSGHGQRHGIGQGARKGSGAVLKIGICGHGLPGVECKGWSGAKGEKGLELARGGQAGCSGLIEAGGHPPIRTGRRVSHGRDGNARGRLKVVGTAVLPDFKRQHQVSPGGRARQDTSRQNRFPQSPAHKPVLSMLADTEGSLDPHDKGQDVIRGHVVVWLTGPHR